jgi:hypothetical protein
MQRQIHIPLHASRRGLRPVKTPGWTGGGGELSLDGPAARARDFGTTPILRMARGAQRGAAGPGRSVEGESISIRGLIRRVGGFACLGPDRTERRHRASGILIRCRGGRPAKAPHRAGLPRAPTELRRRVFLGTRRRRLDRGSRRSQPPRVRPEATGRGKAPRSPDQVWRGAATSGGARTANRLERFTLFTPSAVPRVSDYPRILTEGQVQPPGSAGLVSRPGTIKTSSARISEPRCTWPTDVSATRPAPPRSSAASPHPRVSPQAARAPAPPRSGRAPPPTQRSRSEISGVPCWPSPELSLGHPI